MEKPLSDMTPAELHASDPRAIELLARHFAKLPPVELLIDGRDAWMLIGLLQLVLRHPGLPPNPRQYGRKLVDALVSRVSNGDVEVALLLRRGDDPAYDFDQDGRAV